jgi:hypothetical protein
MKNGLSVPDQAKPLDRFQSSVPPSVDYIFDTFHPDDIYISLPRRKKKTLFLFDWIQFSILRSV